MNDDLVKELLFGMSGCPECHQQLNQQELTDIEYAYASFDNTFIKLKCVCNTCDIAYDVIWDKQTEQVKHIPTVVKRFKRIE